VNKHRPSQRADRDLRDIYLYGVENFGLAQAERYRLELDACFAMLSEFPRMGRLSDTIRAGLRRHEHGSHVVIYKEHPDHVLIVAVVHGRSLKGLKL
jgi:toxin ParE1/3/4